MELTHITGAQEFWVFQNSKKTLAVQNCLQLARWDVFSRIHNPGGRKGKDGKGNGYPSVVKLTGIDTTSEPSKMVEFNLSPAEIRLLMFKLERLRKETFEWTAERLHSFKVDKNTGRCPDLRLSVSRIPRNQKGEAYRSPWFIKFQQGTAIPEKGTNGNVWAKKGSWQEESCLTIMLSDDEYYTCLSSTIRGIELWEEAYGIPHVKAGNVLAQIARARAAVLDRDGVLVLSKEQARQALIEIAYAIVDSEVQTGTVTKAYNELVSYYGQLVEIDFSAFKLQAKKAHKNGGE